MGIRLALVASTLAMSDFANKRDRRAAILGSVWGRDCRRVTYRVRLGAAEKVKMAASAKMGVGSQDPPINLIFHPLPGASPVQQKEGYAP